MPSTTKTLFCALIAMAGVAAFASTDKAVESTSDSPTFRSPAERPAFLCETTNEIDCHKDEDARDITQPPAWADRMSTDEDCSSLDLKEPIAQRQARLYSWLKTVSWQTAHVKGQEYTTLCGTIAHSPEKPDWSKADEKANIIAIEKNWADIKEKELAELSETYYQTEMVKYAEQWDNPGFVSHRFCAARLKKNFIDLAAYLQERKNEIVEFKKGCEEFKKLYHPQ